MSIHIEHQIIKNEKGIPIFAVLKYDNFKKLVKNNSLIPNEVVWKAIDKNYSLIRAWREYLSLTQKHVADIIGISQSAYAQLEKKDKKLRSETIQKIASALNLFPEQLQE